MCQLCGVGFNSPKQAESHYTGQKHRSRVAEMRVGPTSLVPVTTFHSDRDLSNHYSDDFLHSNSCMSVCVHALKAVLNVRLGMLNKVAVQHM